MARRTDLKKRIGKDRTLAKFANELLAFCYVISARN